VVNHLRVVAGAGGTHVGVSTGRGKRLEHRLNRVESGAVAADHEAEAFGQTPYAAGNAGVDEGNAAAGHVFCAPDRVLVVAVAAVDEDIAFREARRHGVDDSLRRTAGRDHYPD